MFARMKNRIREHRKARGWTLDHLAEVVGTSKGHLSGIENGKRDASLTMLRSISNALGISEVDLFAPENETDEQLISLMQDFVRLSAEDRQAVARHARGLLPPSDD